MKTPDRLLVADFCVSEYYHFIYEVLSKSSLTRGEIAALHKKAKTNIKKLVADRNFE